MENHLSLFQDTQYITDLNDYFFDADGDKIAVAESIAVEYAVEGTNETVTVPPRELIYAAGSADDPGSQTFAPYWIHPPEDVGGQATKEYSFSTNEENVVRHYPHRTKIGEVADDAQLTDRSRYVYFRNIGDGRIAAWHDLHDGDLDVSSTLRPKAWIRATDGQYLTEKPTEPFVPHTATFDFGLKTAPLNEFLSPYEVQEDVSSAVTHLDIDSENPGGNIRSIPPNPGSDRYSVRDGKTHEEGQESPLSPVWKFDQEGLKIQDWDVVAAAVGGNHQGVDGVAVDLETGQFQLAQPLTLDASAGAADLALGGLIYDSSTVNARPVIQATLRNSGTTPVESVTAFLRWFDPTTGAHDENAWIEKTFEVGNSLSLGEFTIAMDAPQPLEASGVYGWELELTLNATPGPNETPKSLSFVKSGATTVIVLSLIHI